MNLQSGWQDLGYGVRLLRKSRGFALVAILTIAIGIGGTSSVFSIVRAVLLEPLPYADADRLLSLSNVDRERGITGISVSFTKLQRIQERSRTIGSIAGYFATTASLRASALAEQLPAAQVTRTFFDVFAVTPILGRTFRSEEDAPGGANVAIVSYSLWVSRLGGDPSILGRSISVDGKAVTVIGVLPATFHVVFQQPEPDLWLPRVFENPTLGAVRVRTGAGYLQVFARSRAGASLSEVQSDLNAVDRGYKQDHAGFADSLEDIVAVPLKDNLVSQVRPSLLALLVAVSCVLLIGCANLTNLLLAKANGRRKELAIRTALGATRVRLIRQLLTEALLISLLGGALGVLLAISNRRLLRLLPAGTLPRADEVTFSPGIMLFSAGLTLVAALLFGFLPSLQASKGEVHDSLKESSRGGSSGLRSGRSRALLVGSEVALAVLLLSGAGLLVKSFARLLATDPGFDSNHVLTLAVPLPPERYPLEKQRAFFRRLLAFVESLPQVKAVATVNALPLVGVTPLVYCCPEGFACKGIGRDPLISIRQVTPDYFRAMGIPLLRGRSFDAGDNEQGRRVVVINQTAAKLFFPGKDPIGQGLQNSRDKVPLTIVGVVKDTRFTALNVPAFQEMYLPNEQGQFLFPTLTLVVRSDTSYRPLAEAIRRKVAELDPDIPVANITTLDEAVATSIAQPRLTMQMSALFALIALSLTIIGIYGVLAYSVSQQVPEIGIRMALGATPRQVVAQITRRGMRIVALGLLAGVIGSLALTRFLQGLLFGISARDPYMLMMTAAVVSAVGWFACYIPARRASRVVPSVALQQ